MKSFRKGNRILGVHINSIAGRDKLTKPQGPNPLEYLGITYSATGDTATLHEKIGGNWQKYSEIDGSTTFLTGGVTEQYRGKFFILSRWYKTYDWVSNDGYNTFADWVA